MKITKQVTTVTTEEVEITLPAYFKQDYTMYKVINESEMYEICLWSSIKHMAIRKQTFEHDVRKAINYEPITEHEFNNFLANALDLAANLADEATPKMNAEHSHLFINEQNS